MKEINIDLNIGFDELDITARDDVSTSSFGRYKSVFKGKGIEFDSYRQFTPDDDASMIDRLASARSNSLVVRQYVEERNMEVFFLMDVSNTMILSSQKKLKCEYAAELASAMGFSIVKAGDNIGFALFNDKVVEFSPPGKGFEVHSRLINTLSKVNNYGGGYNLSKAIDTVLGSVASGGVVIVISDFIGLGQRWEESVKLLASKFSVIGLMVRDPIDRSIPLGMGQLAIADPVTGESMIVNPNVVKPYYDAEVKKTEHHISTVFQDNGADFLILQTNEAFGEKIIEMFKMREMRWK